MFKVSSGNLICCSLLTSSRCFCANSLMDPFEASANSSIDTYINPWSMWMHSYHMFWLEFFIIPTYMFKVSSGNLIYYSLVTSSRCFCANSLILYNQKSNPFRHMARLDPELHLWCLSVSRFTGVGMGIAKFMGSTRSPPGSCRPQMGPMLAPCYQGCYCL